MKYAQILFAFMTVFATSTIAAPGIAPPPDIVIGCVEEECDQSCKDLGGDLGFCVPGGFATCAVCLRGLKKLFHHF